MAASGAVAASSTAPPAGATSRGDRLEEWELEMALGRPREEQLDRDETEQMVWALSSTDPIRQRSVGIPARRHPSRIQALGDIRRLLRHLLERVEGLEAKITSLSEEIRALRQLWLCQPGVLPMYVASAVLET